MNKIIPNDWARAGASDPAVASILSRDVHPEGLDVCRLRFDAAGARALGADVGAIVTVLAGEGALRDGDETLALRAGVHLYLPPGRERTLRMGAGATLIELTAPAAQARGTRRLVRDEQFVSAAAYPGRSVRWVLTAQYLSRRVFLHHDETLCSSGGRPVSWFHTTMFDVQGLPTNDAGEPVFKMSYNYRTEFNVCYDVAGEARVRFAEHPYVEQGQAWSAWEGIDGETTYHLNEPLGGADEERDAEGRPLRNRHEVYISGGHVSLCCLFDPAPTGVERHRPGAYSDYGPLEDVLDGDEYASHLAKVAPIDAMMDTLSEAHALGALEAQRGGEHWPVYEAGQREQRANEAALAARLRDEGSGRDAVLARWMLKG